MNQLEQFRLEDRNPPTNIESLASRRFNEEAMRELDLNSRPQRACVLDQEGYLVCGPLVGLESPTAPGGDDGFELAD